MSLTSEQLYDLLPAVYRTRDVEYGGPLKALVEVIAEQAAVMESDIAGLYENWFIETCDEWVVPYIGDLLAVRGLHSLGDDAPFSQRGIVANTLGYRRRKGTAAVLEQLAHDTTGWNARAVEFFRLLEWNQNQNHIRPANFRTPDLRRTNELELVDTAFDTAAHTADVRSIKRNRGWHNIVNVGLFIWRIQSYPVTGSWARPAGAPADGRFTFNPLGLDAPLFNSPAPETEITHLAEEANVPGLLRRRPLYDELEAWRQALVDAVTPPDPIYFGDAKTSGTSPVLQVFVQSNPGDPFVEAKPEEIVICDLTAPVPPVPDVWLRPPTSKLYQPRNGGPKKPRPIVVAVDPVQGRLAFPKGITPNRVRVSYAYGFSADVGGGPYHRRASVAGTLSHLPTVQWGVSKSVAPVPGKIFDTLTAAVAAWNAHAVTNPNSVGVIAIMDSATYEENLTGANRIKIPANSQLLIVAADWPETPPPFDQPGPKQRLLGQFEPDELRPHLLGDINITGTAPVNSKTPGGLDLNGLLVEGKLTVDGTLTGNLGALGVSHCTLVPSKGGLAVTSKNDQLEIAVTRSICGPIALSASVRHTLRIVESIVDGNGGIAVGAASAPVELEKVTIIGRTNTLEVEAGNSIFTDRLTAVRRQTGCVRFSYVPPHSSTPRRYYCQPELALKNADPAQTAAIRARLIPSFTSERYGHYAYGQLNRGCAPEIGAGADDGSEMGAFNFLRQPQRLANLETSLDEYLRFGLEAGAILVT
jgi:hypothetical protein